MRQAFYATPDDIKEMLALYEEGKTFSQIARMTKFARVTVTAKLKRHFGDLKAMGLPVPVQRVEPDKLPKASFPEERLSELIKHYSDGLSFVQMERIFVGQTEYSLRGAVRRLGLPRRLKRDSGRKDRPEPRKAPVAVVLTKAQERQIKALALRGVGLTLIAAHVRQPYKAVAGAMQRQGLLRARDAR